MPLSNGKQSVCRVLNNVHQNHLLLVPKPDSISLLQPAWILAFLVNSCSMGTVIRFICKGPVSFYFDGSNLVFIFGSFLFTILFGFSV